MSLRLTRECKKSPDRKKATIIKNIRLFYLVKILVENLISFNFLYWQAFLLRNKLRLSTYTRTPSGNPTKPINGLCWLSLSVLNHFFLFPLKKGCKKRFLHPFFSYDNKFITSKIAITAVIMLITVIPEIIFFRIRLSESSISLIEFFVFI